jgi:hypothetical protein
MIESQPIPIEYINKILKSICKLNLKDPRREKCSGTGFFMEYKSLNFLITVPYIIPTIENNLIIDIELSNKNIIKLNLNNRYIKSLNEKGITAIEIKQNEIKDIQYLKFDLNYIKGYSQYNNSDVFLLGYPKMILSAGSGKIIKINDFYFCHTIPSGNGSGGSPIILFNSLRVIGVHKGYHTQSRYRIGVFIGELIKEIDNDNNKNNNLNMSISSFRPEIGEKILSINFMTLGSQDIGHYSLPCKNTQRFNIILEQLYRDFPQFRNKKLMFMLNAKPIENLNRTIEEIGIKSNDIISIMIVN